MLTAIQMFGKYNPFLDKQDREYRFVKYFPKIQRVQCWEVKYETATFCESACLLLPISKIPIDTLKELGIWDKISIEKQTSLEQEIAVIQKANHGKMAHARKGRKARAEFAHLPREIECLCGHKEYIPPSILVKKAGLDTVTGDEQTQKLNKWLSEFRCAECSPRRRGRARNPLYKDIPRSVKCNGEGCSKECTLNAKAIFELTKGKKEAIKAYADSYLCRSCNPEWGSWLKGKRGGGRQAKPENVGFPKTAKCIGKDCGKEVKIAPDNIRDKAKKLKVTVEYLLANYRCRSCGGVIPHKKKRKKSKKNG